MTMLLLVLKMEKGAMGQGVQRNARLEAGTSKDTGSALELPEKEWPCHHFGFSLLKPIFDLWFLELQESNLMFI